MRRTFRVLLVCWLCSSLAFAGCSQKPQARFRIVVIPKGLTHLHWQSLHAGAKKAEMEHFDVEIIWEGPAKEDGRQEQQNIVERRTSEGVSAIVLAPCDRQTLVGPVAAALKKGIFVVIIDSGLDETPEVQKHPKYLGYVATDNEEGGRQGAHRMVELFQGKPGKVLMIPYQKGSESTELRERGFQEVLAKAKDLELIVNKEEAGATIDSAHKAAERMLRNHPKIDGIFAPNESSATGVLQALRGQKGLTETMKFVGFDGSPVLIEALRAKEVQGLVLQDPFNMGDKSVSIAINALQGKMPTTFITYTHLGVATPQNLDTDIMRALYAPDLAKYLPK